MRVEIRARRDKWHRRGSHLRSQAVLAALMERLGALKLFCIVAVRTPKGEAGLSSGIAAWLQLDGVHHLEMGALAPEAGRELIAATATQGALPEPCVQFILQHASAALRLPPALRHSTLRVLVRACASTGWKGGRS